MNLTDKDEFITDSLKSLVSHLISKIFLNWETNGIIMKACLKMTQNMAKGISS